MKILVELTPELIELLSIEQAKIILKQLTADLKEEVNGRISRIKAELNVDTKDFHHGSQTVPDSVINEIQKKYDNSNRSLMMIMNEDYPDLKYRTVYGHIKLKKKSRR